MSSGKGKEKKREIDLQNKVDQSIQAVNTPDPFQEAINKQAKRTLDWENREGEFAGKAFDLMDMPGLEGALDTYGAAQQMEDEERFGASSGVPFSDSVGGAYGEQLKLQKQFERERARGESISNAAQAVRAQAHGMADASIERDMARRLNVAQLQGQNLQSYYGRPKDVPWWQKALGIAGTGVGAVSGLGWKPLA